MNTYQIRLKLGNYEWSTLICANLIEDAIENVKDHLHDDTEILEAKLHIPHTGL